MPDAASDLTYPDVAYPDPGPRPVLAWIPVDALTVDDRYQRTAESSRSRDNVRQIAAAFAWNKFQPVTVTEIEPGRYAVIDGQHRVLAARQRPDIGEIPCWIVQAPELRTQARAFIGINRDRVAINPIQMHHAAVAAGDPDAVHIAEVTAKVGVSVPRNQCTGKYLKPGETISLAAIRDGLRNHGDRVVIDALTALSTAYRDVGGQLRGGVITAMIQFFALHKGRDIDLDRLVRVLSEIEAGDLESRASDYRKVFGGKAAAAIRVIVTKEYNKRLAAERRLPEQE